MTIRTGRDAALISVAIDGVSEWTVTSLDAAVYQMIDLSLKSQRETGFSEPVRVWNFLPGICNPIGDNLDHYRVFNLARHRAFVTWFGNSAIENGRIPTASCVGHRGLSLATHVLSARGANVPIENPRQVPAFAYSKKFGPKPPCFSRAGLVDIDGRRLLLVAGTASVRGEASVHNGSLEAQLCETMVNLRAVVAQGRHVAGHTRPIDPASPLGGVLATRVYYKRSEDLARLEQLLPGELVGCTAAEFVQADICREELLVEIEIIVDVTRA